MILTKIAQIERKPRPKEMFKTAYLKKLEIDLNKMQQEGSLVIIKGRPSSNLVTKNHQGPEILGKQYLRISQYNKIEKKTFEC